MVERSSRLKLLKDHNPFMAPQRITSVGIDLMGADVAPDLLAPALAIAAGQHPRLRLVLFGLPSAIPPLPSYPGLEVVYVDEYIDMQDLPLVALRKKRRSSLHVGLEHLKKGHIEAFLTLGNTGAVVGASSLILPPFSRKLKPSLATLFPTLQGHSVAVLDVGALISLSEKQYLELAYLGAAFQKTLGISRPRVGLLNIGIETFKGKPELQRAFELLQKKGSLATGWSFMGNVEASHVFQGAVDVVVTDGFTGNIFLKTAEATAEYLIRQHPTIARSSQTSLPGACLMGLEGLVFKCHGQTSPEKVMKTILEIQKWVELRFLSQIKNHFDSFST